MRESEVAQLLRQIREQLDRSRLFAIEDTRGEGNEFLSLLIQNNRKLDKLIATAGSAQGGLGDLSNQVAALNADVDVVKTQLGVNTQLLTSIQTLLIGLQTGLGEEDKAGLAAGLAQLQNTNAVLATDKQSQP